jgi:hypothetical protein
MRSAEKRIHNVNVLPGTEQYLWNNSNIKAIYWFQKHHYGCITKYKYQQSRKYINTSFTDRRENIKGRTVVNIYLPKNGTEKAYLKLRT